MKSGAFILLLALLVPSFALAATLTSHLEFGSTGSQVTTLQNILITQGFLTGSPTGYFGPYTRVAVMNFQKSKGFEQTGIVGPQTRTALNSFNSPTSANPNQALIDALLAQVKILQAKIAEILAQRGLTGGGGGAGTPSTIQNYVPSGGGGGGGGTSPSPAASPSPSPTPTPASTPTPSPTPSPTPTPTPTPSPTPPADTTPPSVTITAPATNLFAGVTQTTLSATTNENATCRYSTNSAFTFTSGTLFTTTGALSHTTTITGLTNGTSFTYYVKCRDAALNTSGNASVIFSVNAPTPPPAPTPTPTPTPTPSPSPTPPPQTGSILPSDRTALTNWANAGMTSKGGIPNRTTQCGATLQPGNGSTDDSARIQAAVTACPVGQVVQLAAGTFVVNNTIVINKGITLRGVGAGTTMLTKTNGSHPQPGAATGPNPGPLILVGPALYGNWAGNPDLSTNSINLTADAAPGSNSITVANASKFSVGQIVILDENTGAGWQPDVTGGVNGTPATSVWASPDYRVTFRLHNPNMQYIDDFGPNQFPSQAQTNGDQYSRLDRVTNEIKEIASISGNTITFTSPVTISYRVSHTAQLTWYSDAGSGAYVPHVQNAGVEGVSLSGGDAGNLDFNMCAYCWAKNIESSVWSGIGIGVDSSFRVELRDFYSHDASYDSPGGGSYAIGMNWGSSDVLIENGISVRADKVMVSRAAGAGSVIAYNYTDMGFIDYNQGWIEIGLNASHFVGPHHVLFEGNYGVNGDSDNTHGSSVYMTYFRNWLTGIRHSFVNPQNGQTVDDTAQTSNGPRRAAGPMSYSYWFSYIGNVMGVQGKTNGWTYEGNWQSGTPAIWMMGWGDTNPDSQINNSSFAGHIIRDGNWDWLTGSQHWHSTPAGFTIPNSLYLSAKPAFFGTCTWPWVDATTGTTYTLPAKARYDAGTPNVVTPCGSSVSPTPTPTPTPSPTPTPTPSPTPPADTTPPTVTVTGPSGTLAAGTTQTNLAVTTNETATCAWSSAAGAAFASMTTFSTTGATSHSTTLTGLTNGTSYTRYVKCKDSAGNISPDSTASFSVASAGGGGTSMTIGDTSVYSNPDNANGQGTYMIMQDATLSQQATLQSLSFYIGNGAGQLVLGIYDATGVSGGPGTLKAQTAVFTPAVGWNTQNVVTPVTLPAGKYWLTFFASTNNLLPVSNQSAGAYWYAGPQTFGALPSTPSVPLLAGSTHWSYYATLSTP